MHSKTTPYRLSSKHPIEIGTPIFRRSSCAKPRTWIVCRRLLNSIPYFLITSDGFNIIFAAHRLWGNDHDFTLEEVLSEITFFRGESYHTIHECFDIPDAEMCITSDFAQYAQMVRSNCSSTVSNCRWNGRPFECCKYFQPIQTELGTCYALNSKQIGYVLYIYNFLG